MPVPISLRLALRQWRARPLRPILCSLAIAAAVALIVCIGATFDSLRYSFQTTLGQLLGVAEVHVHPAQRGTDDRLPDTLLSRLRDRSDVELAAGRLESHGSLTHGGETRWFDCIGVDPVLDERLRPKNYSFGKALSNASDEVVVDSSVAEALSLKVGDHAAFSVGRGSSRDVTVVGIVRRPSIELISRPTIYVPLGTLANDLGTVPQYSVIDLKLRESAGVEDYDAYATALNKELGTSIHVSPGTNSKAKLSAESKSIQVLLSLLSTISGICAALIIGTTLSVGVQERVRQFGQLRCIGASRRQLALLLIGDAVIMLLLGEAIGILLGFGLSALLVWYFPQFFLAYKITYSSIVIAIINGCFATALGAFIPMWQITQVTPMAAITSVSRPARIWRVWLAALIGFCMLATQVLLWNLVTARDSRFFTYMFIGAPLILLGWPLLGPASLVVSERFGAAIIGRLFFIRPSLLRSAWSRTPWRAGAMIAALMISVTIFTTVRARGQSLLASWVSPARLPDLLLYSVVDTVFSSYLPGAAPPPIEKRAQMLLSEHPEITDVAPIATFPVRMQKSVFKVGNLLNNATNFVAVDPASFPRLVEMEYFQGNRDTALRQLAQGGYIFVTKEFYNVRGLGVGSKLTLVAANGKPVDFTIAAVVTSTGMELVKNYFDMRTVFSENAVSSVLGSLADARKYFRSSNGNIMLINVDHVSLTSQGLAKLKENLAQDGFQAVSSIELKNSLRAIVTRVVDSLSIVAFAALCVASLGVTNMVIASIHARRFEFGVLRAIGAGRSQLVRLVLAEVTLIALVAGVLGAAAGLQLAFMACLVDKLLVGFPTNFLAIDMPHMVLSAAAYVAVAIVMTTLLAWLASFIPAVRGAATSQRVLLAGGRA